MVECQRGSCKQLASGYSKANALSLNMCQEMVKNRCEENGDLAKEGSQQKSDIKTTSVGLLYSIEDTPPWYSHDNAKKSCYLKRLTQLVRGYPSPRVFVIFAKKISSR